MSITTLSSRELNQDVTRAKKAALLGPVFITDRGKPAFALLRIEDFHALSGEGREMSLLEMMHGLPGTEGIDYEAPRIAVDPRIPEY